MSFSAYTGWAIPEGNVVEVADASGRVLWSAVKPIPCTVAIKQFLKGTFSYVDGKLSVTLDGQTYKPLSSVQSSYVGHIATVVVPSETEMHCCADSSGAMMGSSTITVNNNTVQNASSSLVEYDYTLKGDVLVLLDGNANNPMTLSCKVSITEIPEGCIAFIVNNSTAVVANVYIAKEGMTWGEWVNSAYNTDGYKISGDTVKSSNNFTVYDYDASSPTVQKSSDTILANRGYIA